jgi:alkaline phosphatase
VSEERIKSGYKDIARQLIEEKPGRNMNVIFGGGRDFLGASIQENQKIKFAGGGEATCNRTDGINLVDKYLSQFGKDMNKSYVKNTGELLALNYDDVDQVLGLFANNHLMYESLREKGSDGHPSLSELTKAAIRILDNNKNTHGFVLMVEGGKIDQAHHQNHARLALEEMVEFDRAIQEAYEITSPDTLIIVTADHAHSMIFNGYATRGNDILGVLSRPGSVDYETLMYATGPGFFEHTDNSTNNSFMSMSEFTPEMRSAPTYKHMSMVGMTDAVHSGEDVGVFAVGPGSNLIQGVFEQSYIPYAISFASCIGPLSHHNPVCRGEYLTPESKGSVGVKDNFLLLSFSCLCILFRAFL